MEELSQKVEQTKCKLGESLNSYHKNMRDAFDDLKERILKIKESHLNEEGRLEQQSMPSQSNVKALNKRTIFSSKVFVERPSLLTIDGQSSSFRTLENIFMAFMVLLGV